MADTAKTGKYAEKHHRIRVSEDDLDLIVSALRQQKASRLSEERKGRICELIDRFIERRPGRH
jgi:transcriptional regulator of NAD metabolism